MTKILTSLVFTLLSLYSCNNLSEQPDRKDYSSTINGVVWSRGDSRSVSNFDYNSDGVIDAVLSNGYCITYDTTQVS